MCIDFQIETLINIRIYFASLVYFYRRKMVDGGRWEQLLIPSEYILILKFLNFLNWSKIIIRFSIIIILSQNTELLYDGNKYRLLLSLEKLIIDRCLCLSASHMVTTVKALIIISSLLSLSSSVIKSNFFTSQFPVLNTVHSPFYTLSTYF